MNASMLNAERTKVQTLTKKKLDQAMSDDSTSAADTLNPAAFAAKNETITALEDEITLLSEERDELKADIEILEKLGNSSADKIETLEKELDVSFRLSISATFLMMISALNPHCG